MAASEREDSDFLPSPSNAKIEKNDSESEPFVPVASGSDPKQLPLMYHVGDVVETRVRFGKTRKGVESWIDCVVTKVNEDDRSYDLKVNNPEKYNVNPDAVHVPESLLRARLDSITRNQADDLRVRTSSLLDRFEEVNSRFQELRCQVEGEDDIGALPHLHDGRSRKYSESRSAIGTIPFDDDHSDSGRWSPTGGSLMSPGSHLGSNDRHFRQPSATLTEFFGSQTDMDMVTQQAAEQFFEMMEEMERLKEENIRLKKDFLQSEEKVLLYQQTTADFEQKYSELLEESQFLREEIERYDIEKEDLAIRLRKQTAEIMHLEQEADIGRKRESKAIQLQHKLKQQHEMDTAFSSFLKTPDKKNQDTLIRKLQSEVEQLRVDLQNSLQEHERKDDFIDRLRKSNLDSGEEILKLDAEVRKLQSKSKNDVLRLHQMRKTVTDLQEKNFQLKTSLNEQELTGAFNNPGDIQEYENAQKMLEEENRKLNQHLRVLMQKKTDEDENMFTLFQQLGETDMELSKSVRLDLTTDQDREASEMEFFFLTALSLQINLNQKYELYYEENGHFDRPSVMSQPIDEIWKSAQCDQIPMNKFHEYIDTYFRAKCLLPQHQAAAEVASKSKKPYCVIS